MLASKTMQQGRVAGGVTLFLSLVAVQASAAPNRTYAERIADQASAAGVQQQKDAIDRDRARFSPPTASGASASESSDGSTSEPSMSAATRARLMRAGPACDELGGYLRSAQYRLVAVMLRHDPFREQSDAVYQRLDNIERAARWDEACKSTPAARKRIFDILREQFPPPPLRSFQSNHNVKPVTRVAPPVVAPRRPAPSSLAAKPAPTAAEAQPSGGPSAATRPRELDGPFPFYVGTATVKDTVPMPRVVAVASGRAAAGIITLTGHASEGELSGRSAVDLGMQRAEAMKAALVSRGIDASRIKVESAGSSRPIADTSTKEGREKNARVEMRWQ